MSEHFRKQSNVLPVQCFILINDHQTLAEESSNLKWTRGYELMQRYLFLIQNNP